MRDRHCRRTILLTLLALVGGGCEVRQYDVSTRLDRDGTIHREIRQPLDNTLPPEALEDMPDSDATSQPASRPAPMELAPRWRNKWAIVQLIPAPPNTSAFDSVSTNPLDNGPYFKAIGDFESIEAVPGSYYRPAVPLPDRASEDLLTHSTDDYHLFAIEHWEEEITETISLAEYIAAADDFSRLLLPPFQKSLDELYGQDYELKDLHTWMRRQLAEAFRQYCLWFYQYHPGDVDDLSNQGIRDLKAVFALMDVDLPLTEKGDVDLESWPDSLDESAVQIVRHNVRFKDGQELSEEEAGGLWDQIQADLGVQLSGGQDDSADQNQVERTHARAPLRGQNSGHRRMALSPALRTTDPRGAVRVAGAAVSAGRGKTRKRKSAFTGHERRVQDNIEAPEAQAPPALSEAWEQQFATMYGEDGQMQFLRIDAQLGGAHHNSPVNRLRPLFGGGPVLPGMSRFNYALETSGPIIETNGVRLADNRVRWKFTSEELFPDGISMTARAIRWNRAAERKLFGAIVLKDIGTVVKLVDAIELDGPVEQALGDAVKQGNLSPIQDLIKDDDPKVQDAARRVMELKH